MAKKKPQEDKPGVGHNSNVSGNRLTAFVERIERLEEEKKAAAEDIADVYQEVKATGFETKIVKKIVKLRAANREKLREEKELTELYLSAMGDPDLADAFS